MNPDKMSPGEHLICLMECLFHYVKEVGDVNAALTVLYPFPQLRLTKHFAAWLIDHREAHVCADRLLAHLRDELFPVEA